MIDPDKRKAIFQLHTEGMSLREISRRLHVSRKTVRKIIQQQGQMPDTVRKDKREIDPDLLRRLYHECRGWAQRVHERLQEEEDIAAKLAGRPEVDVKKAAQASDRLPEVRIAEMITKIRDITAKDDRDDIPYSVREMAAWVQDGYKLMGAKEPAKKEDK
jgi:plasmid maintenance system antidote protein VapI